MELVGRRFGHFRITDALGQGGMGDVYAAWDEKLERKVAVKVLNPDQRLDEESRARLLREARALSKLDHPNICRIYDYIEDAGDGVVDLLVLEYIEGETLHTALEKRTMSRSEKLRIAIQVAQVLIDAHRTGIVHRDLKPENVMLTKSGEVKVLDFGLARWFNKSRSQRIAIDHLASSPPRQPFDPVHLGDTMTLDAVPSRHTPSGRRDFQGTALGIALGTPIFMSPEQARGEELAPASDMFSFGLLLQTLFTGKDPHPPDITAREVLFRVAQGQTLAPDGAPRDVAALIQRLKRFAPADRPTAVETLERLRFMDTRPQRILRRLLAAAIVLVLLIGTWRYTVDLQRERAVAMQRQAEVEELLEFMLGDLRKKLEPVGRLEVLEDVAQRALDHVSSLDPEKMNAEELTRSAKALHQLVQVRLSQQKYVEARELASRALQLTTRAVAIPGASPDAKLQHSFSLFWLGRIDIEQKNYPQALERMKAYAAITDELAREHPTNETYVMERAWGHNAVAKILERQGDLAAAVPHYETTIAVQKSLLAAKPGDAERQTALTSSLNNLGFTVQKLGRLKEARELFAQEMAIVRRLVAADPENRDLQARLTRSLSYSALAVETLGDVSSALPMIEESRRLSSGLHAHDPSNKTWTFNLASAHMHLSWLLRGDDVERSLREAIAAERVIREMLAANPGSSVVQRRLALALVLRAETELASGAVAAARSSLEAAETALGSELNGTTALDLRKLQGDVAAASGDRDRAVTRWEEAVAIYRALPEKDTPTNQSAYVGLLLRLGRPAEAAPLMRHLESIGYRAPDYVAEVRKWGRVSA